MSDIKLEHFTQLPLWLRSISSDYLHYGHRAPTSSYIMCLKSLFSLHTETMNIWTHLIPSFVFVILLVKTFLSDLDTSDKIVIGLFLVGAFLCHVFSTAFHTFLCHSERVCKIFQKLDYCGIAILITFSFVPWLHYGFYYEEPYYTHSYLAGVLTMAALAIWFSTDDRYRTAEHRVFRALGFAIFGLFGVVPCFHWLVLHRDEFWANIDLKTSFLSLISMGVLYIVGASLYASRVPERFFPASLVHYYGLNYLLDHVKSAQAKLGNAMN